MFCVAFCKRFRYRPPHASGLHNQTNFRKSLEEGGPKMTKLIRTNRSAMSCLLICVLIAAANAQSARATLTIDANKVENLISPILFGQFAEFMFEDIKGGLSAE